MEGLPINTEILTLSEFILIMNKFKTPYIINGDNSFLFDIYSPNKRITTPNINLKELFQGSYIIESPIFLFELQHIIRRDKILKLKSKWTQKI